QGAACVVLNAIYEEDFLGFSYGFRPKRSPHDALDALMFGIYSTKVNYIFDADLRRFFDSVSQQWLIRFLKHRIADRRMIHLIQKWLQAGVLEDGVLTVSDTGTGQRSVISPLATSRGHGQRDHRAVRGRFSSSVSSMSMTPAASGPQCAIDWRSSR